MSTERRPPPGRSGSRRQRGRPLLSSGGRASRRGRSRDWGVSRHVLATTRHRHSALNAYGDDRHTTPMPGLHWMRLLPIPAAEPLQHDVRHGRHPHCSGRGWSDRDHRDSQWRRRRGSESATAASMKRHPAACWALRLSPSRPPRASGASAEGPYGVVQERQGPAPRRRPAQRQPPRAFRARRRRQRQRTGRDGCHRTCLLPALTAVRPLGAVLCASRRLRGWRPSRRF